MEDDPLRKPRLRPTRGFTPEALANARRRYEETDEPQASIALDLGTDRRTLNWVAKKHGWSLRKDPPPRSRGSAGNLPGRAAEKWRNPGKIARIG